MASPVMSLTEVVIITSLANRLLVLPLIAVWLLTLSMCMMLYWMLRDGILCRLVRNSGLSGKTIRLI